MASPLLHLSHLNSGQGFLYEMQSFIFWMFLYQDHVELFLIILWHSAHKPVFVSFIYRGLVNTNLLSIKSEGK